MTRKSMRLTKDGRRINDRAVQRGLRLNIAAGCMGLAWLAMTQAAPLTLFLEALKAPGVVIGLVTTILQFTLVLQIPGAFICERLSSRKPLWGVLALLSRLLWFVPALLPLLLTDNPRAVIWITVVLVGISASLGCLVTASWLSWMADLVPDRIRGRFWGVRQSYTFGSLLVATLLAGWILDLYPNAGEEGGSWNGFAIVFAVGALLGALDIIIHLFVPEPRPGPTAREQSWMSRIISPLKEKNFRRFTVAMGLWMFAVGVVAPFGVVILRRAFGVSYSQIAAITVASSIGIIISGFLWGYIMDRLGARTFGVIMSILAPAIFLVWFFVSNERLNIIELMDKLPLLGMLIKEAIALLPETWAAATTGMVLPQPIWLILVVNVFGGAFFSGVGLCQLNITARLVPKSGRTMAMAVHWAVVGSVGSLGSLAGGRIMDYFVAHPVDYIFPTGTHFAFIHVLCIIHMLIAWFLVTPLILSVDPSEGDLPVGKALARLMIGNPLRAVQNIYVMGMPAAPWKRARAVRLLGEKRTAIAVSDLIEKLDDASFDVREEAAYALGSIGSPDAVDALISKLEDPDTDLAPQIARALRSSRDPRSVDVLMRKLVDPDRETRSETARTLGEIGDRRAVPTLLNLLHDSKDAKVVNASSEALARMGELAAIYDIIPRMKETRNPVLKRSMSVAVGDLLGERDGFYLVLSREEQTSGSEMESLLREVGRNIKDITRKTMTSEGGHLLNVINELQEAYDEEDYGESARLVHHLGLGLAALDYGVQFGGDSTAFLDDLIWRDQRFGVGMWYLELLWHGWEEMAFGARDEVDILLGVYFLACHCRRSTGEPQTET